MRIKVIPRGFWSRKTQDGERYPTPEILILPKQNTYPLYKQNTYPLYKQSTLSRGTPRFVLKKEKLVYKNQQNIW